jgi:hypothetical protein
VKKTSCVGVAMIGLLLGCATAAPPPAPTGSAQAAQQDKTAAADPDNELVCEEVPITGSHLPQRVCRTRRQIQREREAAQKALQNPEKVNRRLGE